MEMILTSDSDFQQLGQTLRSKAPCIKSLKLLSPLSENPTEPDWNSDLVRGLFKDVSALPSLESISLENFGMHSDSVPIHLLSILLATKAPLLSFHLNCVCIMGTDSDMEELARQVKKQTTLQSFRLSYCAFSTLVPSTCTLDPVIMALSSLSTLKSLELWSYAEGRLGNLQRDALAHLLLTGSSRNSLQALHVEGFALDDDLLIATAMALRDNASLQQLDLHIVKLTPRGSLALVESLRHNYTLQVLELFLANIHTENDTDTPVPLQSLLSSTAQQKHHHSSTFLLQLANVLADNSSLQDLRIHSNQQVSSLEEEAFANLLETNTVLQFLHLSGFEGDCRPKIEYFLSWNRRGRLPLQRKHCQWAAHCKQQQQQQQHKKAWMLEGQQQQPIRKIKQRQRLNQP